MEHPICRLILSAMLLATEVGSLHITLLKEQLVQHYFLLFLLFSAEWMPLKCYHGQHPKERTSHHVCCTLLNLSTWQQNKTLINSEYAISWIFYFIEYSLSMYSFTCLLVYESWVIDLCELNLCFSFPPQAFSEFQCTIWLWLT